MRTTAFCFRIILMSHFAISSFTIAPAISSLPVQKQNMIYKRVFIIILTRLPERKTNSFNLLLIFLFSVLTALPAGNSVSIALHINSTAFLPCNVRMFDFELNLFYQSKRVERAGDSKQFQKHAYPQVFLNLWRPKENCVK